MRRKFGDWLFWQSMKIEKRWRIRILLSRIALWLEK